MILGWKMAAASVAVPLVADGLGSTRHYLPRRRMVAGLDSMVLIEMD